MDTARHGRKYEKKLEGGGMLSKVKFVAKWGKHCLARQITKEQKFECSCSHALHAGSANLVRQVLHKMLRMSLMEHHLCKPVMCSNLHATTELPMPLMPIL
jgi:hypothetical protein